MGLTGEQLRKLSEFWQWYELQKGEGGTAEFVTDEEIYHLFPLISDYANYIKGNRKLDVTLHTRRLWRTVMKLERTLKRVGADPTQGASRIERLRLYWRVLVGIVRRDSDSPRRLEFAFNFCSLPTAARIQFEGFRSWYEIKRSRVLNHPRVRRWRTVIGTRRDARLRKQLLEAKRLREHKPGRK
jgi:hypothetical protein